MNIHEPTLFDEVEAILDEVEANAAPEWVGEADKLIRNMVPGTRFIGEQVVEMLNKRGVQTHDTRALGPILRRLAREHVIVKTPEFRPAKTSHGAPKAVWKKERP
jgi:hypothetical protein